MFKAISAEMPAKMAAKIELFGKRKIEKKVLGKVVEVDEVDKVDEVDS